MRHLNEVSEAMIRALLFNHTREIQNVPPNSAVFHRRIPSHQMPIWAERLHIELTEITVQPFDAVLKGPAPWKEAYWAFQSRYGTSFIKKNPLVWQLLYRRLMLKDHAEGKSPHDLSHKEVSEQPMCASSVKQADSQ